MHCARRQRLPSGSPWSGAMGAGKSSVLSYALTTANGFAALPISVAPESDETVTDPGAFAQHAVRVISTWAAEVEMLAGDARDELLRAVADSQVLPSRSKQSHAGIALQLPWIVKGELARDIRRELEPAIELERSAVEHLEALKRLARLIRAIKLEPLLIIDDSDRWLRRGEPRPEIVGAFFGRACASCPSSRSASPSPYTSTTSAWRNTERPLPAY